MNTLLSLFLTLHKRPKSPKLVLENVPNDFLLYSGWTRPRVGDVSPLHCLCVHAPHLGKVQQGLEDLRCWIIKCSHVLCKYILLCFINPRLMLSIVEGLRMISQG